MKRLAVADCCRRGEEYVCSLLLSCCYGALVVGISTGIARCCILVCVGVDGGVACWIVKQDFGNVGVAEQWEGELKPGYQVRFCCDVLGDEWCAFLGVVLLIISTFLPPELYGTHSNK